MRRLLTTLMILLVVLVAGLSALVLLVNPNDFRAYMIRQVEERSGYQLALEGRLRWHVWPQLSILSGRMSLTAPGASQPLVSAANMRLDVGLLPLLSHRLDVRQVMIKGAVIQLTPQTEARPQNSEPVAPKITVPLSDAGHGWSFAIGELSVADSLLVFERHAGDQITMRNINLQMTQDGKRHADVTFSGSINRNQRDLDLQFEAALDRSDYPANLSASLSAVDYKLSGADLPPQGIAGQGMMSGHWSEASRTLSFSDIKLSANDSDVSGAVSVVLDDIPTWRVRLQSERLNFDNLLVVRDNPAVNASGALKQAPVLPRPVIAQAPVDNDLSGLSNFDAQLALRAATTVWRGMTLTNLDARLSNQRGLLTINTLQGSVAKGHFSLPGTLDARQVPSRVILNPQLENISLRPLLTAFNYPQTLSGQLTLQGTFSGNALDAINFRSHWQGNAQAKVNGMRLEGMNFLTLIQQAVARGSEGVDSPHDDETATTLNTFSAKLQLNHGMLQFSNMAGVSPRLTLTGQGQVNLMAQQCDVQFNIRTSASWKGDQNIIARLQNTAIPLRIYGPWDNLNYHLDVDKELRKSLQNEARTRLKAWADRNKGTQRAKDADALLNE